VITDHSQLSPIAQQLPAITDTSKKRESLRVNRAGGLQLPGVNWDNGHTIGIPLKRFLNFFFLGAMSSLDESAMRLSVTRKFCGMSFFGGSRCRCISTYRAPVRSTRPGKAVLAKTRRFSWRASCWRRRCRPTRHERPTGWRVRWPISGSADDCSSNKPSKPTSWEALAGVGTDGHLTQVRIGRKPAAASVRDKDTCLRQAPTNAAREIAKMLAVPPR